MTSDSSALKTGMAQLGFPASEAALDQLCRYLNLLEKWNHVYNLTAIRDRSLWASIHVLDSLAAASYVEGPRVIDVGTGAGLPGIPLAICRPEWEVLMIDSVQKKAAFVSQVIAELRMSNATVRHDRVEHFQPLQLANTVISRAFADIGKFAQLVRHLLLPGGRLVAMKGIHPADELRAIPEGFDLIAVHRLQVPGLEAERHVAVLQKGVVDSGAAA